MNFSLDNLSLNNFSLNESNVLSAVRGGGVLGLINSVLAPSFGIYYAWNDPAGVHQKGGKPFSPDSFVVVEVGAEASVSTAPVEQGAYTTFNKIQRPPELHVTFTVEGGTAFSGAVPNLTNFSTTSRSNVLETLEMMRTTAGLYDIETPDKTWTSYDLVKYDYRTRSNNGPTLLTVSAVFQAVMNTGEVSVGSTDIDMNGDTTFTVADKEYDPPYPEYVITWQTLKPVSLHVSVTLKKSDYLPSDITQQVQQSVLSAFNGTDGGLRARVASVVSAGRYYACVYKTDPENIDILGLTVSRDGSSWTTAVTFGIDEIPVLDVSNIGVKLQEA